MQKDNGEQAKTNTKKPFVNREKSTDKKNSTSFNKEKIDEQKSDESAGAFAEFIDERNKE